MRHSSIRCPSSRAAVCRRCRMQRLMAALTQQRQRRIRQHLHRERLPRVQHPRCSLHPQDGSVLSVRHRTAVISVRIAEQRSRQRQRVPAQSADMLSLIRLIRLSSARTAARRSDFARVFITQHIVKGKAQQAVRSKGRTVFYAKFSSRCRRQAAV